MRLVNYQRLGSTGLKISRLGLGCGNFGGVGSAPAFFGMGETEAQAADLLDRAWGAGINLLDTADAYGGGRSEQFIGRWAISPQVCASHGGDNAASAALVATDTSLSWFEGTCRIGKMYKAKAVYVQRIATARTCR